MKIDKTFFKENVREDVSGCWIWKGSTNGKYGIIQLSSPRRNLLAHRVSYKIHVGEILDGEVVCHSCDIPTCVNPAHLWTGTQKQNVQDMISKGRHSPPPITKGSLNGRSRLTEVSVAKIRNHLTRGLSLSKIASMYSVSKSTISAIKVGRLWKLN